MITMTISNLWCGCAIFILFLVVAILVGRELYYRELHYRENCCQYCNLDGCAPCPNPIIIDNVSKTVGKEIGPDICAGEWGMYCNLYLHSSGDEKSCWREEAK